MKLIPAIDILDGRCVRLMKGDYTQVTDYGDPVEIAKKFYDQGSDWVHLVDLEGARDSANRQWELIAKLKAVLQAKIQWGGGVRSLSDCEKLLAAGIDRILVGSMACKDPYQVSTWFKQIGIPSKLALAIDVRWDRVHEPQPYGSGWLAPATLNLSEVLEPFMEFQGLTILCTDIERDGTMQGPALDLYAYLLKSYPQFQWIASGGIRNSNDLIALQKSGVWAAVAGRAILEGALDYANCYNLLSKDVIC